MEQIGVEVQSVTLTEGNIVILYENGESETLPNNQDTFRLFYNNWLKDNPPFISDQHKIMMRNIILASINNNQKCLSDLNGFFQPGNEETVKKFLTYMRKREETLPEKKAIWKTVQ